MYRVVAAVNVIRLPSKVFLSVYQEKEKKEEEISSCYLFQYK